MKNKSKTNTPDSRHLNVRVIPKASRNHVVENHQENERPSYRIYVTTAPEDGKANKAVIELLAKYLKISKSSLTIVKGETSRDKILAILIEQTLP